MRLGADQLLPLSNAFMSTLEEKRAAAQAEREKAFQELGLAQAKADIEKSRPKPAPKPAKPRKSVPAKRKAAAATDEGPRRRSMRGVAMRMTEEEIAVKQEEEEQAELERRKQEEELKHADRPVEALSVVTDSSSAETLTSFFADLAKEKWSREIEEAKPVTKATPKKGKGKKSVTASEDDGELVEQIKQLKLHALVKIVPERIYSMQVHPSVTKDIIFAGDKNGHLGVWDATEARKVEPEAGTSNGAIKNEGGADEDEVQDDDDSTNRGSFWNWKAHRGGSISSIRFNPTTLEHVYTGCYDRTVRRLDFETGVSTELINTDDMTDQGLVHAIDFTPDGRLLWVSDDSGGLIRRDLRSKQTDRWQVDAKKVGCVSVNQANPDIAVTSHLRREIRLWDLRILSGLKMTSEFETIQNKSCLATFETQKACSSAYFDPLGTRIVATSYDDTVRFFDVDPHNIKKSAASFEPSSVVKHDNQVGRYVTVFKAQWAGSSAHGAQPHCTIGNMRHTVDVISHSGKMLAQLYDSSLVTATPAVTASHPILPLRYYGGTASGKVSFFAPV